MTKTRLTPARPYAEARWLRPVIALIVLAIVTCAIFGVFEPRAKPASPFRDLAVLPSQSLRNGLTFQEVHLPGGHDARVLWIYEPPHAAGQRLPCVFIAPDSSTCFYGKSLRGANLRGYLPFADAGFVVVAYSLDGATSYFNSNRVVAGIERFRAAHCGVDNEHAAVDYALANLPCVDPRRLYAVGHSSGGTMALMAAAHDTRIAACVAFAPACDVSSRINKLGALELSMRVPGFTSFLNTCSPISYTTRIHCPVFLFHADNDGNVPRSDVEAFVAKLRHTNPNIVYSHVPAGGHLLSMFDAGIPRAIVWLKKLAKMS